MSIHLEHTWQFKKVLWEIETNTLACLSIHLKYQWQFKKGFMTTRDKHSSLFVHSSRVTVTIIKSFVRNRDKRSSLFFRSIKDEQKRFITCGLYYKCFTFVIYRRNDSGLLWFKTTILTNLAIASSVNYDCRIVNYDCKERYKLKRTLRS